jgi:hypothetical protein
LHAAFWHGDAGKSMQPVKPQDIRFAERGG